MQQLISENVECADCGLSEISTVDVQNGVFLCSACGAFHDELKYKVKTVTSDFEQEELLQLSQLGNSVINRKYCRSEKPWFPTPAKYPFPAVRRCYIRAKYLCLLFADSLEDKEARRSLEDFWFVLDEVSEETPQLEGPLIRSVLIEKLKDGSVVRPESYVWHPVFGPKWLPIEKTHNSLLLSPESFDSDSVHRFYELRRYLSAHQPPHLRGLLDVQTKGKILRRWIMLLNTSLYISTLAQSVAVENVFAVEELTFELMEKEGRLGIRTITPVDEFLLWALNPDEVLEWFTGLTFSKYMIEILASDDFPHTEPDPNEQHICNVPSSANYMGEKVMEGTMRKEGSHFKTIKTRWFVLRTQGLYYYKNQQEKSHLGMMQLKGAKLSSLEQYRYPNHMAILGTKKVLHLWTDDTSEKEKWMKALISVIESLPEASSSSTKSSP